MPCSITQKRIINKLANRILAMRTKVKILQHNRVEASRFASKSLKAYQRPQNIFESPVKIFRDAGF